MKQKSRILLILFTLLIAFTNKSTAQIEVMANYVFANDSIAGFDEQAASAGALSGSFYGREYKVYMYRAKRDFIKQKYQLNSAPIREQITLFQNTVPNERTTVVGGSCNNEDFELATAQINAPGAVQGWVAQSGTNNNSCNPPIINGNNNYTVFVAPTVDDKIGTPIGSYFDATTNSVPAGNAFIRMNDATAGAKASKLSKSFIVTPTNALFQYAYLPVIEDGSHGCCDQAGFNIRITVTNTVSNTSTVLACPQISVAVPGAACQFTAPAGSPTFVPAPLAPGWSYHPWAASAIDLTPYLGNQITLEVVVVDCNAGGHGGYAYFDARCAPMDILGNGTPFPAGTPSVTLPTCGATSATICAPAGLGPYSWAGPTVVAPYNTPSMSNQCYTTSINADFTLSMNPPGSCSPILRVVTVTITPAPLLISSVTQAVCGGTAAIVNYTAAGSAAQNSTILFNPTPVSTTTTQNTGSATFAAGTGVVFITAIDPLGCIATSSVNINTVPPQPTVTILNVTGSPSITCSTPSVDLSGVSSYTYGTLNYFWSSNSFTANGQNFTATTASTLITLTAQDPVTGCVATATTAIQMNTVAPTSSVSPVNQNITCGAGVVATATGVAISPTTNVTHSWYSPGSPVPVSSGGQISIYSPGITGSVTTSTFVLTNNINGCSTTKTIQVVSNSGSYPTFSVTSSQNFSVGCNTRSLTNIVIAGAQSGGGGVVSYTVLSPGYNGGLSYTTVANNIYTVTTPGTYTVIVKDNANQCESRLPVSIIQNTFSPNISADAVTRTLTCAQPSVVLAGNSTNNPVDYRWSFQNGNNPNVINNYSLVVNTNSTTALTSTIINTFTLTVTDQNNACISTSVVTMWQNTRPPNALITPPISSLSCAPNSNSVNLNNFSTTGIAPNTFFISQPIIGLAWTGPTPQLPKANSSTYLAYTPGIYTMIARDENNGCTASATATITDERDFPVLSTNTLISLDCGASTSGGVRLPVTVVGMAASAVTATWYPPTPTPNLTGINTLTLITDGIGEYKIVVKTTSNSCMSQKFVTVVNGVLNANFTPDQTSGYAPLTVNFTNNSASTSSTSGSASITSVWSFGNGTVRTTTTNVTTSAIYTQPGTYTVTMFASKGSCLDTISKVITVDIPSKLEVPNVFTPNGDNNNDLFFVKASNLTDITAQIFDRWGNKIYELTSSTGNIAWDGKNQAGKEVPAGTYFYTIKATGKDGQNYDTKGTVSLFR